MWEGFVVEFDRGQVYRSVAVTTISVPLQWNKLEAAITRVAKGSTMDYAEGSQMEKSVGVSVETVTSGLQRERTKLTLRLAEINSTLDLLEQNPAVQTVLDALARLGHLRAY